MDFATTCPYEDIELHLFADSDHRLTDRKERLWRLMMEFLDDRGLYSRKYWPEPLSLFVEEQ